VEFGSARSSLVSPSRRRRSTSAWFAHDRTAVSVRLRPRATLAAVFPG
jgi:hypothetical protein